jgi:hypothetical protein
MRLYWQIVSVDSFLGFGNCLRPSLTGATVQLVEKAPAGVGDARIKELLET